MEPGLRVWLLATRRNTKLSHHTDLQPHRKGNLDQAPVRRLLKGNLQEMSF